jgi:hypothetical protein
MWTTDSDWEGCCWRDVDDRLQLKSLLLKRCGSQVRVGTVFVGELRATGSDRESCR